MPTHILILGQHELFAQALGELLHRVDSTLQIVGHTILINEEFVAQLEPDLIIVDCDCNEYIGRNIEQSRRLLPGVKICCLFSVEQSRFVNIEGKYYNGLAGYMLKDISPLAFAHAIYQIMTRGSYIDHRMRFKRRRSKEEELDQWHPTEKQIEIIKLIAAGCTNNEISRALHLKERTIKNYVSYLLSRFHCSVRTQIAVKAIRSGLFTNADGDSEAAS